MLKSNFETTILDLEGSVSKVAALKILWTKIPLPDNVCPFYQIIWQRLWHILIIKYSDNVCDMSISSSILTMSVTYLYHQIFWQCLWHIYIIIYSGNVCDIARIIWYCNNVCDISVSWNDTAMSLTYLYHQIFWQCLWHIFINRYCQTPDLGLRLGVDFSFAI